MQKKYSLLDIALYFLKLSTTGFGGAVAILGKKSLIDIPTILIALISIIVLWKYKKITEPYIIIACAVIGFILKNYVL